MKTISQKDRYEKDTTKNGAIQLVHNKEVQMTQHSIAIRQLHSEIMHYKTKIKEEEITKHLYFLSSNILRFLMASSCPCVAALVQHSLAFANDCSTPVPFA